MKEEILQAKFLEVIGRTETSGSDLRERARMLALHTDHPGATES